ncbi:C-signal [Engraulis encrasicolus]|uniref:C-signal n=1 Tax=Engraulis encrasicolus TaxID=184585 RepID=UPI002FD6162B
MAAKVSGSVLVTGANRGIGLEVVRQLSESPCPPTHIFAGCRDPHGPGAKALRELAQKHPQKITTLRLDQTDQATISEAARQVGSALKGAGLNLLINNAGINQAANSNTVPVGNLAHTGEKEMTEVFLTNTVGPMIVTKEFLPYLRQAASLPGVSPSEMSCRRAAVVNVSTLFSSIQRCHELFLQAPMYPYRVSKAALNMLTRCLSEDLKSDGILVMALHPGWVQTDMGGPQAPLSTEDSVRGMLSVISSLSEQHVGSLLDWEGRSIPW